MLCPIGWDSLWEGVERFLGNQIHLNSLLNSKKPKQMSLLGFLTSKSVLKLLKRSDVCVLLVSLNINKRSLSSRAANMQVIEK